jgi:XTP/dITP diphosphohydrolase
MIRPGGVVVASKNPDKVAEMEAVLGGLNPPIEIITGHNWADIEEVGTTLVANALLKAHAVVAATGHAAIADDTGLEVDALHGAPGVRTARYAGEGSSYHDNVTQLLFDMASFTDRSARFRTAVALVLPSGDELVVEGVLEGTITSERRGDGGFGYDPVFEVVGRTLAEIPAEEKNRISHRALALMELAVVLSA